LKDLPLTAVDVRILRTLARVRFATERVLELAGAGADEKNRKRRLRLLMDAGLVASSGPVAKRGGGRLPAFYKLTDKGALRASPEVGAPVSAPQGASPEEGTHAHTEGVARAAVALQAIAAAHGGRVGPLMLATEVEPGARFRPKTALRLGEGKTIIPDLLAGVVLADGRMRPLAVEYENGANVDDARHALKKREIYDEALREGVLERALGCEAAPRLLLICSTPTLLRKVWEGWAKPGGDWPAVYMQAMDALEAEPGASWYRIGAEPSPLFPTL